MSEGPELSHLAAYGLARRLVEIIAATCERVEIAGSLRRIVPVVHDVDLLAIPKIEPVRNLIGDQIGTTLPLDAALADAEIQVLRGSNKCRVLQLEEIHAEIWFTDPPTWGCRLVMRTGHADYSKWMVTQRKKGGATPNNMYWLAGRLYRDDKPLATPEETDVYRELGLPYLQPRDRTRAFWRSLS
jgi:DNA polymerase/3'-5' exonuclease PolX